MAQLSRRLWGGTSLKTAAKEGMWGPDLLIILAKAMVSNGFMKIPCGQSRHPYLGFHSR